jgi:signal peptidase I
VPTRPTWIAAGATLYLLVGLIDALLTRTLSWEAFETDGPSMEPTLENGDRFILAKDAFGLLLLPGQAEHIVHWADPEPGQVVVLTSPADQVVIVKRVIGVAGDRIAIREGVVYRNGEPLERGREAQCPSPHADSTCISEGIGARSWTTSYDLPRDASEELAERVVPPGTVFVMGDHRDRSNDSRNPRVGFVPTSRLHGLPKYIYWSSDFARLGHSVNP